MRKGKWLGLALAGCVTLAGVAQAQDKFPKIDIDRVDLAQRLDAPPASKTERLAIGAAEVVRNSTGFAGAAPFGIAEDNLGNLFVGELFGGSIFIYDKDLNLQGSIPSPASGTTTGIAFGAGSLWVVDATAGTIIETDPGTGLPTGAGAQAIPVVAAGQLIGPAAFDSDAGTIWLEDIVSDTIFEIDLSATLTGRDFPNPDDTGSGAFGNGLSYTSLDPIRSTLGSSVLDIASGMLGEGQVTRISRGNPAAGIPISEIVNIVFAGDTFVNGIQTSMHNNVPVHYLVGNATNSIIEIGPPDPIQGPCGTGSVNAGTPPPFFCDTMEGGDGNWSHMALPGDTAGDDWALIATPNASSGTTAWFSADVAIIKDVALDSVPQAVPAGGATLRFKHVFNMETGFDGCVLEASIDGGAFVDLGAQIVEGGYTVAAISTGFSSPIGGRPAWSGQVGPPAVQVTVDLTPFAGSTVVLRYRLACDSSVSDEGWYIDDVKISEPGGGVITDVLFVNRASATFCEDFEDIGGGGGGDPFFCDDMESGDSNWTHMVLGGANPDDWGIIATGNATSGTMAWFSADVSSVKDVALDLTAQAIPAGGAELTFMHRFNMESGFDGCVLEASVDGGAFFDLSGDILDGGYTGTISTSFSSPIAGQSAWTGDNVTPQLTRVDLTPYAGTAVVVRFRLACDSSVGDDGWYIDDVKIVEPSGGPGTTFFCDDMEAGDGNWTHMVLAGANPDDWGIIATGNATSGTMAWFSADVASVKDVALDLTAQVIDAGGAELTFMHRFNMESGFDGCVIEASVDGGAFADLGASIVEGPYTGTISTSFSSPIAGRSAFTGDNGAPQLTRVDVTAFAGSSVVFRFRLACDSSVSDEGWYIDDVKLVSPSGGGGNPIGDNFTTTSPTANGDWAVVVHGGSNSPTHSVFSSDISVVKDDLLDLNEFTVDSSSASVSFYHNYNMESGFDGCVLEASVNGGAFFDLGPDITEGGYDAVISTSFSSPIGGRSAWTGDSGLPQTQVVVDLSSYVGSDIVIRWRLACDSSVSDEGWYVDDVKVGGSDGTGGSARTVTVGIGDPITIELDAAPAGPAAPKYWFAMWVGEPDFDTVSVQPFGVGSTCFPGVITGGTPQPSFILNTVGRFRKMGESSIPQGMVPSAPGVLVGKATGLPDPTVLTCQAILQDTFSLGDQPLTPLSDKPGSCSNAVIIKVE